MVKSQKRWDGKGGVFLHIRLCVSPCIIKHSHCMMDEADVLLFINIQRSG